MKGTTAAWWNTVIAGEEWLADGRVGRAGPLCWPEPGVGLKCTYNSAADAIRRWLLGGLHATPATPIGQQHTPTASPAMVGLIVVPIKAAMVSNNDDGVVFTYTFFVKMRVWLIFDKERFGFYVESVLEFLRRNSRAAFSPPCSNWRFVCEVLVASLLFIQRTKRCK